MIADGMGKYDPIPPLIQKAHSPEHYEPTAGWFIEKLLTQLLRVSDSISSVWGRRERERESKQGPMREFALIQAKFALVKAKFALVRP